MTLYEDAMNMKPEFQSNEEALEHFQKEYDELGAKHNMTGDQYWQVAEHSLKFEEDQWRILGLARHIQMCEYLIKKAKYG